MKRKIKINFHNFPENESRIRTTLKTPISWWKCESTPFIIERTFRFILKLVREIIHVHWECLNLLAHLISEQLFTNFPIKTIEDFRKDFQPTFSTHFMKWIIRRFVLQTSFQFISFCKNIYFMQFFLKTVDYFSELFIEDKLMHEINRNTRIKWNSWNNSTPCSIGFAEWVSPAG